MPEKGFARLLGPGGDGTEGVVSVFFGGEVLLDVRERRGGGLLA